MLLITGDDASSRVRRWTLQRNRDVFITSNRTPKAILQSYLSNVVVIHTNSAEDLWSVMNGNIFVVTTSFRVAAEATWRGANVLWEESIAAALHRVVTYRPTRQVKAH